MNLELIESAVRQAQMSVAEGGLPIGAVLASADQVLATGHNRRIQNRDSIAHAELDCLRQAGLLTAETYTQSVIYSTLSPCWMCAGAIRLYGIPKVVVADSGKDVAGSERWRATEDFYDAAGIELVVCAHDQMINLFRDFLQQFPEKWWGDVGGQD